MRQAESAIRNSATNLTANRQPGETRLSFSWLAFAVSGSLLIIQLVFAWLPLEKGNPMPLSMQMLVNDFGLVLSCVGGGVGIYQFKGSAANNRALLAILLCTVTACGFLWSGMPLWKTMLGSSGLGSSG